MDRSTSKRVRAALAWSIMASLCGLIGFLIVHYYATNVRPIERFAIVIDAGSTQTRSNLFRLIIETNDFSGLADDLEEDEAPRQMPVGKLIKIQQIGSCVNGGPLASVPNQWEANNLIRNCLLKFANQIKLLNFVETNTADGANKPGLIGGNESVSEVTSLDAEDVSEQLALMNHRVNSVTHLHLGATAGMRALEQLNATRADEKLDWIKQSIGNGNQMLASSAGPYINTGYVGTLRGSDEASFGWVSVNFVCDALIASGPTFLPQPESVAESGAGYSNDHPNTGLVYQLNSNPSTTEPKNHLKPEVHFKLPRSIGTIELGGASAQMAFQVANKMGNSQIRSINLEEERLNLFNGQYKLATRSDLCLGMSQAVLRFNYVLLHKTIATTIRNHPEPNLRIKSVCLQNGSSIKLTGGELGKLWQGACLAPNDKLSPELIEQDATIRTLATSMDSVEFFGTGQVDECDALLNEIVQPQLCKRYFSLCPNDRIASPPPRNMPFVTISGYNHALRVLNLSPDNQNSPDSLFDETSDSWTALNQAIEDKLGGRSIAYEQFVQQTREYCSTNVSELTKHYPKVSKPYQNIICLQLVYIRKLLVEFYQLHPLTSWQQIKFLIFEPKQVSEQYKKLQMKESATIASNEPDIRPDIGWTLGLLLNVTSQQLESGARHDLYHHHGASPMYMVRATILLVVACSLIAIAFLVISVVHVKEPLEVMDDSLASRSSRSSSTYNIGNLGYTITHPTNYNSINNSTGDLQIVHPDKQAT